jgi:hypothetical protein
MYNLNVRTRYLQYHLIVRIAAHTLGPLPVARPVTIPDDHGASSVYLLFFRLYGTRLRLMGSSFRR